MNNHTSTEHPRLKINSAFLILGALALIASACTTAASTSSIASSPPAAQATSAPLSVASPTSQTAPASPRDVNSMNACALFPGDVLASALNTTLTDPANKGAGIATQCTYSFGATGTGDGTNLLYNLFLMPAKLFDPSLSALQNSQPVAGLGDKAFIGTTVNSTVNDLMVLKTGDIFIEINGTDPAILQNMAKYILAHLP
jgi:hypothetical protein